MNDCTHGYPKEWRRHCVDCAHADDIADLESERDDWKRHATETEAALRKLSSQVSLTNASNLQLITRLGLDMTIEPSGLGRFRMKEAVTDATQEEYGVGPEGAD